MLLLSYMKKILVTGGAGFIGSNLVDSLIALGHDLVVIDNLISGKESYLNPKAKFYNLDIGSNKLQDVFAKESFDYVYHLAAQIDVRHSVIDPVFDNKVNVVGGINLLQACSKYKVKKVIFASTGGAIYGESDEIPSTEYTPTYPLSPYGINKLALEKYLNFYYHVHGLNYTTLRFANVYGPRQFKGGEAGVIAIFVDNAIDGKVSTMYGDGTQTRDFVYVADVVSALIKAKDIDCRGEINISYGEETNLLSVIEKIELALGGKIKIQIEPAKAGEQKRSCLSRSRAQAVLDWSPEYDLESGIAKTISWAKEERGL